MATIRLPSGSKVVDALTVPNPALVNGAGFGAYCPYLRNFSVAERDAFWAAGVGLILIQERGGNRAAGGAANADPDFNMAMTQAQALGFDGTTSIDYSETDFDVQPSDFPACDSYYGRIIALHQQARIALPIIYGAQAYVNHAASWVPPGVRLWEAAGWQRTGLRLADMTQLEQQIALPSVCDQDVVLTDLEVWSGLGPNPTPTERDDMSVFRHTSAGAVYEIWNGYKFHCTAEYFFQVLQGGIGTPSGTGIVSYQALNDGDLLALPDWPGINPPSATLVPHTHPVVLGTYETGGAVPS